MMADPEIAATAVGTHAKLLGRAANHHSGNALRCRQWSAVIVGVLAFLCAGNPQHTALPWAAAPVLLLALADASQLAMARIFTDSYNRFMQNLPLNGGNAIKPSARAQAEGAEDAFRLPPPELGWRQAGLVFRAMGSFSVWPFYGALLALLGTVHFQMVPPLAAGAQKAGRDAVAPTAMPPQPTATSVVARQSPIQAAPKVATPPPGVRFPPVPFVPQSRFPATRPPSQIATPPKAPEAGGTPALQNSPATPVTPIQGAGGPPATAIPTPNPAPGPAPAPAPAAPR